MRHAFRVIVVLTLLGPYFDAGRAAARSFEASSPAKVASSAVGSASGVDQPTAPGGAEKPSSAEVGTSKLAPAGAADSSISTPDRTSPEDVIVTDQARLVTVEGKCSFDPPSGTFRAAQSGTVKDHLLDIRFEHCQFEQTDDGLDILSFDTRWQFDLEANVNHCAALSTAFLFEVSSDTDGLTWGGERQIVTDLPLQNLSSNNQNASFFQLYSAVNPTPLTIADVLVARQSVPNFDNIYWGHVVLLKKPVTDELGKAIQYHLPVLGKKERGPDYTFKLKVAIADPRGWCWDPNEEGQPGKPANLVFSTIEAGVK
ncbi:hypothetical protein HFO89_10915 [Rhizobium leguminosarum]|uniref:hypothetical protein n=1 Tax=Rhizobium leguminosarum TaxID=384 RepID=UPI001C984A80|nr:hypothetical protein [Rhizobium leguminosarum]MBY5456871.1 hypothetical protein [Rhizobium leguminosarum]